MFRESYRVRDDETPCWDEDRGVSVEGNWGCGIRDDGCAAEGVVGWEGDGYGGDREVGTAEGVGESEADGAGGLSEAQGLAEGRVGEDGGGGVLILINGVYNMGRGEGEGVPTNGAGGRLAGSVS